jgi:hypothetical protein
MMTVEDVDVGKYRVVSGNGDGAGNCVGNDNLAICAP